MAPRTTGSHWPLPRTGRGSRAENRHGLGPLTREGGDALRRDGHQWSGGLKSRFPV